MKKSKQFLMILVIALVFVSQIMVINAQELDSPSENVESVEIAENMEIPSEDQEVIEKEEKLLDDAEEIEIEEDEMDTSQQFELEDQVQVSGAESKADFESEDSEFTADMGRSDVVKDNSTAESASVIKVNSIYSDYLKNFNDVRWYKFEITEPGYISLEFRHGYIDSGSRYWFAELYNPNKKLINTYEIYGFETTNNFGNIGVIAGVYYVKILSGDGYSDNNYDIDIRYTASKRWEKEFNDTYLEADNITINQNFNGSLCNYNDVDWYKFNISNKGYITLTFNHEYIEYNSRFWIITLYNSNMSQINTYEILGTNTLNIFEKIGVKAGAYYIKIRSGDGQRDSDYNLKINYTASSYWETELNDSYSTANNISVNQTYYGNIKDCNDVDWYNYKIEKAGYYSLKFVHDYIENDSRYMCIEVYNSRFSLLDTYEIKGSTVSSTMKKMYLSSGKYYLKIMGYDGNYGADYNFNISQAHTHSYKTIVTKASSTSNGAVVKKCSCGVTTGKRIIYAANNISLSLTSYTYDGKIHTPSVKVKASDGTVLNSAYYTVQYASGRKSVGNYTAKIIFKGSYYKGTVTKYFVIKPATTFIKSITSRSRGFRVDWKKQSVQTSGYQIQYSKKSNFSGAVSTLTKNNSQITKTYNGLAKNTRYYIRIRTYKSVKGKIYYSAWSRSKSVVTKK